MQVIVRTHTGRVRSNNEDSVLIERPALFAIADGMGGYNAGEVASKKALERLRELSGSFAGLSGSSLEEAIHEAVADINRVVYELAMSKKEYDGMGTTLTGVYFADSGSLYFFNVGDSRSYIIRRGKMVQVTHDHSLVGEMLQLGDITPEQAFNHPKKNMLTRGIGVDPEVEADVFVRKLEEGDILLLCSDGLTDMLKDSQIEEFLSVTDLEKSADRMLAASLEEGGRDNITFIMIAPDARKEVG